MQFVQSGQVAQLYTATDTGTAPAGRLMLLLPPGSATPASLTFDQAWQGTGCYLFLAAPVPDAQQAGFASAVAGFLADPRNAGARFAWLPPVPVGGLVQGTVLQVTGGSSNPVTAFAVRFALRNVSLQIPAGSAITVSDSTSSFGIGGGSGVPPVSVTAEWGSVSAGSVPGQVQLSLADSLQGCLRLQLDLAAADLDSLAVGPRYFYAPDPSLASTSSATEFFLYSQGYRLFAGPITVYPSLDPLTPLDGTRSFLAFSAADSQLPPVVAPVLPSYLRSTLNDAFSLTPLTGSAAPTGPAKLVFSPNQQASTGSDRDPLYLTPAGDFGLSTSRAGGADLMGGLSGVESFELPATGSVLSFFPGSPAFAAGFVANKPGVGSTLAPATMPSTSYAWIAANGAQLDYFAQPDQSVLYNYPTSSANGVTTLVPLAAVPVQAATLTWPPAATHAFPLLPYAGAGGDDLALLAQLEAQVISPSRRKLLQGATALPRANAELSTGNNPSPASTTPQGLLAYYVPGGSSTEWSQIVLGQMAVSQGQLSLTSVTGDLLNAFQSNKMFLVVSDPTAIQDFLLKVNAQITIGGDAGELWQFNLDPAGWQAAGTIFIIKFYDQTLEQLATRHNNWSTGAFNTDPAGTSAQIGKIISAAKQRVAAGDTDYAGFVAAVTDPTWNGILALNVQAPLDELPSELRGLAAGIDPAQFKAHHVGINASKITVPAPSSGNPISIADSGIFGLIDYVAPSPLPAKVADWAFQVETLKVLFSDSQVTSFSSTIDLQVNVLFAEPATLVGGTNNVVQLYGVYQKTEVNGQIIESYTFQTQSGQDANFAMTSQTLNAVIMAKAQFVTVTSDTTATDVTSQFLFWGLIDFIELESADESTVFDAFSFGRQSSGDRAGLAFSNLILSMSFNPQTPQQPPTFSFDASNLAIDIAGSTPRPHSLFQHLPLTVAGITQAQQTSAPTDLGFMGVQTPLTQSALAFPWFSLNYNLNLGTPGALAAAAGFVASLTVAWSPAQPGGGYKVFLGLKLPGSSGAKRSIPIEGLFDISFKSLQIVSPEPDTFVLVLYGIGFSFFSFTFPPSGQVNFALFGDPGAQGKGDTSLGWYAAYAKSGGSSPSGGNGKALTSAGPKALESAGQDGTA